jgi:hypothetical protein
VKPKEFEMSALGMHPKFSDKEGYTKWMASWRSMYKQLSREITDDKLSLKKAFRESPVVSEDTRKRQRNLVHKRVMAHKMMTLHKDAKARWKRILEMQKEIEDQMASFPLTLEAPSIDFHFNKGSIEFPFLPAWIVKCKGKSYYLHHVDFDCLGTTRETPEHPSTKGSMRFRQCSLELRADGTASIKRKTAVELAKVA